MNSLFAKISSKRFKECPNCRVEKREGCNSVLFCDSCTAYWRAEGRRLKALEPTEESIREIVNDRVELFAAKGVYEYFYEKWMHEMPYGTAKARDGDPYQWVLDELCKEYSHLIEEEEESA